MVRGIEGLSVEEIRREVARGGRFVYFTWCISIILVSFHRTSGVYFLHPEEHAIKYGWRYFLTSFFLGWWEFPGGVVHTARSLHTAFKGKDITQDTMQELDTRFLQDHPVVTTWESFNRNNENI
ncbi:MAG: hypothetical protein LBP98_08270 [Tannerella sp.]|jgi:hypothetical protein|nr:hypothetical protein [Tannerella sp.]